MDYKNMLIAARNAGVATEKMMWQSIDGLNEMLCKMKEEHPVMFWKFMREQQVLCTATIMMKHLPYMMFP